MEKAGKLNSLILGVIHAALKGMEGMNFTREQIEAVLHKCEDVFDIYTATDIRKKFPH